MILRVIPALEPRALPSPRVLAKFGEIGIQLDLIQAEKFSPAEIVSIVARMKACYRSGTGRSSQRLAALLREMSPLMHGPAQTSSGHSSPYMARACDLQVQIAPLSAGSQVITEAA